MKAKFVQELNNKKITNTAIFNCCCIALPFLSILLLLFVTPSSSVVEFCKSEEMATLGGLKDSPSSQNSLEIESLARFAVDEHNKKENALLELGKVVKAQEQVVAGTLHHLTLEVIEAGKKKLYEAKIWVKPWLNFKELQEFKHVGDVPSCTQSDLGVKKDPEESDWQSVVVDDPVLQDAAKHAVKTIQQRSNSLLPYELHEILHAKAAVNDGAVKFDMLLKLNRGDKQEKFKVEVSNHEGSFKLNQMTPDHS